jgi:hypothetical protein
MKKCLAFLLLWVSAALAQTPTATPLDPALTPPELWDTPAASWVEANQALGFGWVSATHDAVQSTLKGATFLGIPVCQTLLRCQGDKLVELNVLFYSRGDRGEIDRTQYEALIRKTIAAISTATQTAFVPKGRDATNAVKVDGVVWTTPALTYVLEYSCTKTPSIAFRSEFVRLKITPTPKPKSLIQEALASSKKPAPFRGADHVTRDAASGDVAIKDVPMVDQGQKGYCVVATAERVLRYYGVKADENELAQLADSDAQKGTNDKAMTESLTKLTARLKIRVRTLVETDLRAMIDEYNQVAKHARVNPVNFNVAEASELFSQVKPEILRESRNKNRAAFGSFNRQVKSHINEGVPMLWSVTVGVLDTDGTHAKTPCGHMRLIIGYNEKTNELLFSDSWGAGHELKRMPASDAWAITHGLVTIEPL